MKAFLTTLTIIVLSAGIARADGHLALGIQGDELYSFATSKSQKNGVVGGDLENISDKDIVIVRAESSVAEKVELHTHIMDGDVMMMREVESYEVPAGDDFELGPRAEHIMLIGLKTPLKQGDIFSIRLFDANDISIEVPVYVRAPGDIPEEESEEESGE